MSHHDPVVPYWWWWFEGRNVVDPWPQPNVSQVVIFWPNHVATSGSMNTNPEASNLGLGKGKKGFSVPGTMNCNNRQGTSSSTWSTLQLQPGLFPDLLQFSDPAKDLLQRISRLVYLSVELDCTDANICVQRHDDTIPRYWKIYYPWHQVYVTHTQLHLFEFPHQNSITQVSVGSTWPPS